MKRRRRILLTLVSLLVPAGLIFWFTHSNEPTYQGKTLSQWLYGYYDEVEQMGTFRPDAPDLANPTRAIKAIGTNGVPTLLKLLQARDINGSQQLESFVRRLGWETFNITPAEKKWDLANFGFLVLGKDAKFAVPELLHLLNTSPPDATGSILDCLNDIQPPKEIVLPTLIQQLSNTNRDVRLQIAICLRNHYPGEAERAGVYNLFPKLRPRSTNAPAPTK